MANILSLHQRRVFLPSGDDARYAKLYVSASGTNTAIATFSDEALSVQQSRPVVANAYGVFPAVYVEAGASLRILITDENDVALPGYPQDDIVPLSADVQGAADVTFSPTEDLPFVTAQAAIEGAAALSTSQLANSQRSLTPWITGGSANAYTLTPSPAIEAYGTYQVFTIRPNRPNTGAVTINVNGLGARDLSVIGTNGAVRALAAGEIQTGREFMAFFDGTRFYMTLGRGWSAPVQSFLNSATQAAMQTSLGVSVGTQVQAFDADLSAIGALAKTNGNFIVGNGATWVAESGATARTSLGLGSAAVKNTDDMGNLVLNLATVNEVQADVGSPADPSFTYAIDDDTGFYRVSSGTVGFTSNGTLRMSVGSSVTIVGTVNASTFSASGEGVRGQTAGAIGTYAFAVKTTSGSLDFGATIAGSELSPADDQGVHSGSLTGTWRCMGRISGTGRATQFYRVS